MKPTEILRSIFLIPGMPWGVDVIFGRNLFAVAQESSQNFVDVTQRYDPSKRYFVVWNRFEFRDFLSSLPAPDLLIAKGDCKQYCWELED